MHTGANDLIMRCCLLFTCWDQAGAMPSRVAAEVVTAAGLGQVCVADTPEGVVPLVVNYWRDQRLRDRLAAFLARTKKDGIGFFDEHRIPDALCRIVEHYFAEFMRTRGDRAQLKDHTFPNTGPVEIFAVDDRAAARKKLLGEMGIEDGMQESAEALLLWLESELEAEFSPDIVGRGGSTVTLCAKHCKGGNEVLTAVKVATRGRPKDRLHNESLCREALCLWLWGNKMRNHAFKTLLPEPHSYLAKGASFHGHSLPNQEGKVLVFLLCELIPLKFTDTAAKHTEDWQQSGTFHDKLRLNIILPLFQALFWAERKGLYLMDVKPDNLGLRSDGTLAFLDVGQGCVCPVPNSAVLRDAEGMTLVQRPVTMAASDGTQGSAANKRQRGRLPGPLLQGRSRGKGGVAITRRDLSVFQRMAGQRGGLANHGGGGTMGFRDEDEVAAQEALLHDKSRGGFARLFEPKHGFARDRFAAVRTVLFILTRRQGVTMREWDAEALAAAKGGPKGIREMLLRAVCRGVEVQQNIVLDRMVDFLFGGLRPEKIRRLSAMEAMTDEMSTLPILPSHYAVQLASGHPIRLAGGPLHQLLPPGYLAALKEKGGHLAALADSILPALSFVNQPSMGMGVKADEEIPGDAVAALYVGIRAPNASIGAEYAVRDFPSRYAATAQGIKILGGTELDCKVTCDAQLTAERDFEWHVIKSIGGPFMNACSPAAANCVLDRHSVWVDPDTQLVWMLVRTKQERPVAKGDFLMWDYSPTAGAGQLWSFKLRS